MSHNYMQTLTINPPRCECHECTQARWKMSFQGQAQGQIGAPQIQINQQNRQGQQ